MNDFVELACHEKFGPHILVPLVQLISKYLDPQNKMFDIFEPPLKYFIPYKIYFNTICTYSKGVQIFQLK